MINQQLLEYIRAQIKAGASKEDIKKTLASGGWNEQDATEAFMAIEGVQVPSVPLRPAVAPPSVSTAGVPIAAPRPVAIPIPVSTPPVMQKKSSWRLVLALILVVFLLAIAGGVYAVMTYPGLADYVPAPLQDLLRGTPPVETPPTSEEQVVLPPTETATTTESAATSTPTTTTSL